MINSKIDKLAYLPIYKDFLVILINIQLLQSYWFLYFKYMTKNYFEYQFSNKRSMNFSVINIIAVQGGVLCRLQKSLGMLKN